MNKKIFITRNIPDAGIQMLKDHGYEVDISEKTEPLSRDEIIEYVSKKPYDAIITLLTDPIDEKVFDAVPTAKIFANYAVGYNNINIAEANKRSITITNTPGNSSVCVAEHTLALMLGLSTRIVEADKFVREGNYKGWSPLNFIGCDLKGQTLGIIGTGCIGERLAYQAKKGFDMNVIYNDLVRNEKIEKENIASFVTTIEELLEKSDFISLQVPLLDSTYHLINQARLKLMKPSAFLINTSRGPVVDEAALTEALKNKTIAGAALDVFEFEPKITAGLTELPNVILTPHIASARESARKQMSITVAENVISFLETGKAKTPVNS